MRRSRHALKATSVFSGNSRRSAMPDHAGGDRVVHRTRFANEPLELVERQLPARTLREGDGDRLAGRGSTQAKVPSAPPCP
jgi:hypothetical protein